MQPNQPRDTRNCYEVTTDRSTEHPSYILPRSIEIGGMDGWMDGWEGTKLAVTVMDGRWWYVSWLWMWSIRSTARDEMYVFCLTTRETARLLFELCAKGIRDRTPRTLCLGWPVFRKWKQAQQEREK